MDALFARLRPLLIAVVRHPFVVLVAALLLTAGALWQARDLSIDTDFANLLPESYHSVQALTRLRDTVGGESTLDLAIQSPSFEANRAFAEAVVPAVMALRNGGEPLFTRAEFRTDTTFLAQNALYFASAEELGQLETYLQAKAEEARQEANPFFVDLEDDLFGDDLGREEDEDAAQAEEELGRTIERLQVREYQLSPDSTTLVLRFAPSGAQTNLGFIDRAYASVDSTVAALTPARYHAEMRVTSAGRLLRQRLEIAAITDDVTSSFGAGASMVLLAVVLYFLYKSLQARGHVNRRTMVAALLQTPVTALLIGVPLAMSLAWTFGTAAVVYGELNLMTSTLGLVLFGLGIDYGIHFFARYTEERGRGHDVEAAASTTFLSTGQAVSVSAATTAVALYALTIADFRGFSEFGFIGGTGVLLALLATLTVLPALLALAERYGLLRLESVVGHEVFEATTKPFPAVRPILIGSLVLMVLCVIVLPEERFEYNFSKLEPEYVEYEQRAAPFREVSRDDSRRNPAYILVDDPAEVPAVTEALRARAEDDTLILAVESLQERFPPTPAAAQAKLERIAGVRAMLQDPFLQADTTGQIARLQRAASTTRPLGIEEVPRELKQPFTTKSGQIGNFIMVYPAVELSDGRNSMAFAERVGEVTTPDGKTYYAGSTSLVAANMLELMLDEAPLMVAVTFVLIVGLMLAVFLSVRWALIALVPLVVGVLWMLGGMWVTGVAFSFYNLVVLPAVLGIGNDCGVHITHRYREEGRRSLRWVLRSTGEHVAMGAITTMIGFGGLLLSFHPGLRAIGQLAVVGIGTTLLAALLFLPALLQWLEDRGWVDAGAPAAHAAAHAPTHEAPPRGV